LEWVFKESSNQWLKLNCGAGDLVACLFGRRQKAGDKIACATVQQYS
jgi:hypothetical protein